VSIDPQSAMTPLYLQARPFRPPHGLVIVTRPPRALTLAKIAGLMAVTTIGVALTLAVVAGSALFTILNIG